MTLRLVTEEPEQAVLPFCIYDSDGDIWGRGISPEEAMKDCEARISSWDGLMLGVEDDIMGIVAVDGEKLEKRDGVWMIEDKFYGWVEMPNFISSLRGIWNACN